MRMDFFKSLGKDRNPPDVFLPAAACMAYTFCVIGRYGVWLVCSTSQYIFAGVNHSTDCHENGYGRKSYPEQLTETAVNRPKGTSVYQGVTEKIKLQSKQMTDRLEMQAQIAAARPVVPEDSAGTIMNLVVGDGS